MSEQPVTQLCLSFLCSLLIVLPVGIGLGITKHLLDHGANVVIADLNAVAGAKVIDEILSTAK